LKSTSDNSATTKVKIAKKYTATQTTMFNDLVKFVHY
jgi:hypothetical protein